MSHTVSLANTPIKSVSALRGAVQELKNQGINVTLEENAIPRMYYADQMQRHVKAKQELDEQQGRETKGLRFHENPEECDFVLRVEDAYYDIGFIYNKHGELEPFFDDYNSYSHSVPATRTGKGPIRDFLGAAHSGGVQHWSGQRAAGEAELHSIGKLLQGYAIAATVEHAEMNGGYVADRIVNKDGTVQLVIEQY